MFKLMGKKIIKILRKYNFLIWTYECQQTVFGWHKFNGSLHEISVIITSSLGHVVLLVASSTADPGVVSRIPAPYVEIDPE